MGAAPGIADTITNVVRQDRGRLLAALIAGLGNFQLAEDCLQEALAAALIHWQRSGPPDNPQGWLLRVARRKAIDRIRKNQRWRDRQGEIAMLAAADQADAAADRPDIPDERLRLIFTCCHPALEPKTRVALTLRTLGGLSTVEIARAFLDREDAMGQRLSRARAKISRAGIPFAVPGPEAWSARLNSVLTVIYLIFNEGYGVTAGENQQRSDLSEEAIWLGRMVKDLLPDDAEVKGLLSLLLTTHARRAARTDKAGDIVPLDQQDRRLWDADMASEGCRLLDQAIDLRAPGPFQTKAAISALHIQAATYARTDWRQMILLYDALHVHEPSPVVRLNRAVALAEAGAISAALGELDFIGPDLQAYQPYHAARADLLSRIGQTGAALAAYDKAISLSGTPMERRFLARRRDRLSSGDAPSSR
jgi:RNA polymerase sigma factor (sigma-70 family)